MNKLKNMVIGLKNLIFGTNFALLAFLSYTSKIVIYGAALEDSLIFLAIAALYGYTLHLKSKKPDPVQVNTEVQAQINEIQKKIRDAQMQQNVRSTRNIKW